MFIHPDENVRLSQGCSVVPLYTVPHAGQTPLEGSSCCAGHIALGNANKRLGGIYMALDHIYCAEGVESWNRSREYARLAYLAYMWYGVGLIAKHVDHPTMQVAQEALHARIGERLRNGTDILVRGARACLEEEGRVAEAGGCWEERRGGGYV